MFSFVFYLGFFVDCRCCCSVLYGLLGLKQSSNQSIAVVAGGSVGAIVIVVCLDLTVVVGGV